ncbi:MAG: hypothetical protein QOH49_62 [Acidobacteriota bacterium]|nr:hypothetical protein [Acidobacteriota bacterium]
MAVAPHPRAFRRRSLRLTKHTSGSLVRPLRQPVAHPLPVRPVGGFCAETAGAVTLFGAKLTCITRAWPYSLTRRSLSALPITETELKLMAAAAIIGLSRTPKNG